LGIHLLFASHSCASGVNWLIASDDRPEVATQAKGITCKSLLTPRSIDSTEPNDFNFTIRGLCQAVQRQLFELLLIWHKDRKDLPVQKKRVLSADNGVATLYSAPPRGVLNAWSNSDVCISPDLSRKFQNFTTTASN
jgi:hypothetical protein